MHEDPAHDVGDKNPRAILRHVDTRTAARRALGKIRRPQEALLARGEGQRLALIPNVIACRHHIGAGIKRSPENLFGDAETACGVLAIHHHEIQPEIGNQAGELFPDRRAARAADHIAKKQKSHAPLLEHRT